MLNKYFTPLLATLLITLTPLLAEQGEHCSEHELEYSPEEYCCVSDVKTARACGACGVWLPEDGVLFRPFIADPREVAYSAGWRFGDQALNQQHVIDVSYGDALAIYRWFDIGPWCGDLQFEVEGASWAVFAPLAEDTPLLNNDYYIGFPLTYAIPGWQFRLRGYHISSHIGDEYLLLHPEFDRRNPSAEYLDFYASHDFTDEIRVYGGVGYVVRDDETFPCRRFFAEAGAEVRLFRLGFVNYCNQVYGAPFFAMHFRDRGDDDRHIDATYVLGYEWGKLCGLLRNLRAYVQYHDGASPDGQFCREHTNYLSFRLSYGY